MVGVCSSPSKGQQDAISIINVVVSFLSLIGSLLTIISFLYKKYKERQVLRQQRQQEKVRPSIGRSFDSAIVPQYRTNGSYSDYGLQPTSKPDATKLPHLIFMLSVSDFLTSFFIITSQITLLSDFSLYTHSVYIHGWRYSPCVLFRAFIQFFFMSTFFCTACISYYLYQQLSSPESHRFLMYIFGGITYGIPLIITLPLTFTNSIILDPQSGWCETNRVFELTLWFTPLVICLLTCVFYYIRLKRLFRQKFEYRLNVNDRLRQIDGIISRRLTLYILVFIVTWFPDIIQHFISFFSSCSFYPLMVIQNLLAPSQGFCNFFIYSITHRIVSLHGHQGTPEENRRLI